MIDLETFMDLANTDIGEFVHKPTSLEGDQVEASKVLWTSEDGRVQIGIWECTPGQFPSDRSHSSEICHIISGKAEMKRLDGTARTVTAGDLLVLPRGWRGEWVLLERTRKLYAIHRDPS